MSVNDNLRQLIRKYIKEVLKELEETSFSSGAGAYNTPFAFSGGRDKDKKKKKNVSTNSTGYKIVEAAKVRKVVLEVPKNIYGMKLTKSKLREIIREEIQSIKEGGMGILDSDQADILQAIVMRNKSKPTRTLLNLALKSGHFKGVDKKELLGYIDGARQFVKYMKSHPMESVNEGTKVYSMDVDDMVDVLSAWEKGRGGYTDGNIFMGKDLHGKKPEPFYNSFTKTQVSGGLKDALKALTKMWKKLDVKPSTTTKIFKAYHKLPDSKKKFSNPSFWEKFLEKNGISVVAESVNEGSISPTQAGKLFDKLLKKQTKGNLPSTKDIEIVFSLLRKKYGIKGESVNEGKYHTWRNDESLTPKQKIGRSMREIRDHLTEIDKLTKMNVRLKREMGVDSRDYWKNTHKALSKISERLVKLAKRVGEIY